MGSVETAFSSSDQGHLRGAPEREMYNDALVQMSWLVYRVNRLSDEEIAAQLDRMSTTEQNVESKERINRAKESRDDSIELIIEHSLESGESTPEALWFRKTFLPSDDYVKCKEQGLKGDALSVELERLFGKIRPQ